MLTHKALVRWLAVAVFCLRLWLWQNNKNATQSLQHSLPHSEPPTATACGSEQAFGAAVRFWLSYSKKTSAVSLPCCAASNVAQQVCLTAPLYIPPIQT